MYTMYDIVGGCMLCVPPLLLVVLCQLRDMRRQMTRVRRSVKQLRQLGDR